MPIPNEIKNTLEWLLRIEEYAQARKLALTVTRHAHKTSPEISDFIAMILYRAKFYSEALPYAHTTFTLLPSPKTRYNLARCLLALGEILAAQDHLLTVIRERPDWTDPRLDLSLCLCLQGRFQEAETLLLDLQKKLPLLDPHQKVVQYNLAWHMIRRGHLKEGMDALTVGRALGTFGANSEPPQISRLQKGMPLAGKKILILGEAGAGDEIINVRFAQTIQERGGSCHWVTGQKMESLFSRVEGVASVLQPSEVHQLECDYWAPCMDLFTILDLDGAALSSSPYITPAPSYVDIWKTRIRPSKKLKVGLRWQGNPLYEHNLFRSVPFWQFRKFFSLENCEFYSLQKDTGTDDLSTLDPVEDLSQDLRSWEDTSAVISMMDVVVTSCTSIAHLSGALGKKTYVFTPILPYYVWAYPGERSIWYSDVTLFRQRIFHDWTHEFKSVFLELQKISRKNQ